MSHGFDLMCEYGTIHVYGCPECAGSRTILGKPEPSPHGYTFGECPTPEICESRELNAGEELSNGDEQQEKGG